MRVARSHTTPVKDYEAYVRYPEGTIVWQKENKRILVVHLPNWLARDSVTAPKVLCFMAVHGRTYVGTYAVFNDAMGVLL